MRAWRTPRLIVIGQFSAREGFKIKPIPDSVLARLIGSIWLTPGAKRNQESGQEVDSLARAVSEVYFSVVFMRRTFHPHSFTGSLLPHSPPDWANVGPTSPEYAFPQIFSCPEHWTMQIPGITFLRETPRVDYLKRRVVPRSIVDSKAGHCEQSRISFRLLLSVEFSSVDHVDHYVQG